MNLDLVEVHYMPDALELGKIYVSKEFGSCQHLCPCGCGNVVHTPFGVGALGWNLTVNDGKVTLHPSVGNFQFPCKTHYWIQVGEVKWC